MNSGDDILSRAQPPVDARIPYGSDPNQFGELRVPKGPAKGPHPVVMNIHGGFWRAKYDLLHASHLCAALTRAGVATWNLEYRRVGNAGGAWPGTFEDITNGYRFLRQIARKYNLDMTRVVVMGHSAGGHLAVALAGHLSARQASQQKAGASQAQASGSQTSGAQTSGAQNATKQTAGENAGGGKTSGASGEEASGEPRLRGVVSLAGVLDLERAWELHLSNDAVVEFLGGTPAEMPDHYQEADPMRLAVAAEQHLIHGTDDDIVPVEISRKYASAKQAKGERVTLTELPKTGHFEVIDPESAVWGRVEAIVTGLLR